MRYICFKCFKVVDIGEKFCLNCGYDFEYILDEEYIEKLIKVLRYLDYNVVYMVVKIIGELKIKRVEKLLIE